MPLGKLLTLFSWALCVTIRPQLKIGTTDVQMWKENYFTFENVTFNVVN